MTISLTALLKDSAYKLSQFKPEQIAQLEQGIKLKEADKNPALGEIEWVTGAAQRNPGSR